MLSRVLVLFLLMVLPMTITSANQANANEAPYLSSMPNYYVYESWEKEYDVHDFSAEDGEIKVEGKKYYGEYCVKEGSKPATPMQIIRNFSNAGINKGGQVIFEEAGNAGGMLTLKLQINDKEIWVEVNPRESGESYHITIVEKTDVS